LRYSWFLRHICQFRSSLVFLDLRTWCEHATGQGREDGHEGDDADVGQFVVFAPLLGIIRVVLFEVDFLQVTTC